ncbi:MAG: nicotinamide-nucleotide amidohydrolase family protein [Nitrospirae bacterium]|nr:nicotinamide-nucleotide amidohydrolase family protein [Nitrospirota bacterium]
MLLDIDRAEIEELCALTQRVVTSAGVRQLHIATAESCTGGMIAGFITSVPGSSSAFCGGVVTYSNELKMKFLGVLPQTLAAYGAVSRQTALEMSHGIAQATGAQLSVAVTGVAGPAGGTPEKPVGLVYVSLHISHKGSSSSDSVIECRFDSGYSRDRIRFETVKKAISMLYDAVVL